MKLHRCSAMWIKMSPHPCWRVQKALEETGTDYVVVNEDLATALSQVSAIVEAEGQEKFPWIEFEDGSVYREESADMAETIRAGKLDEKRAGPPA